MDGLHLSECLRIHHFPQKGGYQVKKKILPGNHPFWSADYLTTHPFITDN